MKQLFKRPFRKDRAIVNYTDGGVTITLPERVPHGQEYSIKVQPHPKAEAVEMPVSLMSPTLKLSGEPFELSKYDGTFRGKRLYHVYVDDGGDRRYCTCAVPDMEPTMMAKPIGTANMRYAWYCLNCHNILTAMKNDAYNRYWKFSGYDEDGRDE